MPDITVTWTRDTDANVASYALFFTTTPAGSSTANPALTLSVPRSASGDAGGYSANYSGIAGAPALNTGDSVVIAAESIDTFGQASPLIPAIGSPLVISVAPPPPPTGPIGLKAVQS